MTLVSDFHRDVPMMILSSLCSVRLCSIRSNFLRLQGRHCPHTAFSPLKLSRQQKILHLAKKKDTRAANSSHPLLNLVVHMDDSILDELCSNVSPPSETNFTASIQVDASLLKFIVGKGGKVKEKIEKDTATQLQIPPPCEAKRGCCLVVKGLSQANVDDAVLRIHRVLEEVVESPSLEYSHFISLPLALHPDLVGQVTRFHDSVMGLFPAKKKDETVELSSLSDVKSSNQNEKTVASESEQVADLEQTYANHNEEREAFENEQDANFDHTHAINDEGMEVFERGRNLGIDPSNTETLLNNLDKQGKEEDLDCDNYETLKDLDDDSGISMPLQKGHGIEESLFIKPATLHLTVLMLKLWSKERVTAAAEVLQGLHSKLLEALDNRPVAVRLKGVECMRGSPAKAHVLYAKVEDADEKNRLLGACKAIKDAFIEAGLVSEKDKKQELKLHATLMNTSHRKRKRGKRFGRRMPFDARPILSRHGSEEWGEYTITEAHLSERFVYDEDGYYHCCGSIQFPSSTLST